ncbi:MAG: hypothetical protein Q4P15_10665 [Propionibacteriaceae bacterium]|nr:hypothetical protein [Propionibacteriaceae bacterium]
MTLEQKSTRKTTSRFLQTVLVAFILTITLCAPLNAYTGHYATKIMPLTVYHHGSKVGATAGKYSNDYRLAKNQRAVVAGGYIRDYKPGDSTVYVVLSKTLRGKNAPSSTVASERYNDSRWISYPKIYMPFSYNASKVELAVCEDIRFAFDACSRHLRLWPR